MHLPRRQAAGFSTAVIAAALLAWALIGSSHHASASPVAQDAKAHSSASGSATCQGADKAACQAKNERKRRLRHLKFVNAQQKRPNVIVIETDDQNFTDMFVMSQTLGLLGARGTTFNDAYVSYPLCCPSRATFLTGQYAHNHGVLTARRIQTARVFELSRSP